MVCQSDIVFGRSVGVKPWRYQKVEQICLAHRKPECCTVWGKVGFLCIGRSLDTHGERFNFRLVSHHDTNVSRIRRLGLRFRGRNIRLQCNKSGRLSGLVIWNSKS